MCPRVCLVFVESSYRVVVNYGGPAYLVELNGNFLNHLTTYISLLVYGARREFSFFSILDSVRKSRKRDFILRCKVQWNLQTMESKFIVGLWFCVSDWNWDSHCLAAWGNIVTTIKISFIFVVTSCFRFADFGLRRVGGVVLDLVLCVVSEWKRGLWFLFGNLTIIICLSIMQWGMLVQILHQMSSS